MLFTGDLAATTARIHIGDAVPAKGRDKWYQSSGPRQWRRLGVPGGKVEAWGGGERNRACNLFNELPGCRSLDWVIGAGFVLHRRSAAFPRYSAIGDAVRSDKHPVRCDADIEAEGRGTMRQGDVGPGSPRQ